MLKSNNSVFFSITTSFFLLLTASFSYSQSSSEPRAVNFPPKTIWYENQVRFKAIEHESRADTMKLVEGDILTIYSHKEPDTSFVNNSWIINRQWSSEDRWIYVEYFSPWVNDSPILDDRQSLFASKDGINYYEVGRYDGYGYIRSVSNPRRLSIYQEDVGNTLLGFEITFEGRSYQRVAEAEEGSSDGQMRESRDIYHFSDNLKGFDPTRASPNSLGRGSRSEIFDEGFIRTENGFDMPLALIYEGLSCETEGSKTCQKITTTKEYAKELGKNLSAELMAGNKGGKTTYSADSKYKSKLEKISETSSYHCIESVKANKYAFYLDRKLMKLKPEFIRDVKRNLNTPQDAKEFIDKWGTHYPTVVIYGSSAYQDMSISKETNKALILYERCLGQSISSEGDIEVAAFKSELSQGNCSEEANNLSVEVEKEYVSFSSIGADNTSTEMGQASCGDEKTNAPLYIEARPIAELLGPPFDFSYDNRIEGMAKVLSKSEFLINATNDYLNGKALSTELINDNKATWIEPACEAITLLSEDSRVQFHLPESLEDEEFIFTPYLIDVVAVYVHECSVPERLVRPDHCGLTRLREVTDVWEYTCQSNGDWDLKEYVKGGWDDPVSAVEAHLISSKPCIETNGKAPCFSAM